MRGLGIRRLPYEPVAVVGLVVDLGAPDAERLPAAAEHEAEIAGIDLPRLAVAAGADPPAPACWPYLRQTAARSGLTLAACDGDEKLTIRR